MDFRGRLEGTFRRKAAIDAEWNAALHESALETSDREVESFLRHVLHRPHPAAEVRMAHALMEELPRMAKSLAAGEISTEHVRVAVRTLRRIPEHLREPEVVDEWFLNASRDLAPLDVDRLARGILLHLDPDGANTFDPNAVDRRELSVTTDATGMVLVRGQLDPANGAAFKAAIDHFSAPAPAGDGELAIPDTRTKLQRQADAAGMLGRAVTGSTGGTAIPKIVIHMPTTELSPPWLARFACDSMVEAVDTETLELGRTVRTATPWQRRFLTARDEVCVIPNCGIPAAWCDAHHVQWWSEGGPTDVSNMAMVCGRHHTDIHAGVWALEMVGEKPWARPPRWLDPEQKLIRNTYTRHRAAAKQLAIDIADAA